MQSTSGSCQKYMKNIIKKYYKLNVNKVKLCLINGVETKSIRQEP